MACFHPLDAWQEIESRAVYFGAERRNSRRLVLPCGRCIGCRMVRQRAWALRCLHEGQLHRENCFITLTYDQARVPISLDYRDYQRFMYRLRQRVGRVRFFAVGEYGDMTLRPHFHALLFGVDFHDGAPCGKDIRASRTLSELWTSGFSSVGALTYQSAAYVAGYCLKKVTGPLARCHYTRVDKTTGEIFQVEPEMAHMSLKPGIGAGWFAKYWREVYLARDGCVLKGGKQVPAPRYYDTLLGRLDYDLQESKFYDRYLRAEAFMADSTPERLAVREHCAKARLAMRERVL